jgi:hypothetical protein
MATQVQWRGGSTAEHATFTGAAREVTVDTQKQTLVLHDGSTAGGRPLLREDGSNAALALGSAATPSLKFTGDTNTGLYSPGADQVAISTNGTGRLFVDANGNVGINSGAPTYKLQVVAQAGAQNILLAGQAGVSNGYQIDSTGSALTHIWSTAGGERLRLTDAGRLGLGASAPGSQLDVVSPSNSSALRTLVGSTVFFSVSNNSSGAIVDFNDNTGTLRNRIDARVGFPSYITAGNVGINTASPQDPLHVIGQIRAGYSGVTKFVSLFPGDAVNTPAIGFSSADSLRFVGASEYARIDSSGRLLVGTSTFAGTNAYSVSQRLSIAGSAFNGIQVQGYSNDNFAIGIDFSKSRSASVGTNTIVQNGDSIGTILFNGFDGTGYTQAAGITAQVDGTPGTNDMPGRLVFSTTADGASSPTERMRITSTGQMRLAGAGITFNGDTAAANELDDYEEGTWTPTDASGGGLTFAAASGRYTKVGRLITLAGGITFPTTADGSGVKIGGLPFNNVTGTQGCGFSAYVNGTAPGVVFRSQDNTGNIFATDITNQDSQPTNATFSGRDLQFTYIYQV